MKEIGYLDRNRVRTEQEIGYLDRNRVRTEQEIELMRKLRQEEARTDCLLVGNIISWLFSAGLAVALVLAVSL